MIHKRTSNLFVLNLQLQSIIRQKSHLSNPVEFNSSNSSFYTCKLDLAQRRMYQHSLLLILAPLKDKHRLDNKTFVTGISRHYGERIVVPHEEVHEESWKLADLILREKNC